jgi:hypothetical protein
MKAFDARLPIIAKQAGVRTHHVFFTFHAMREMGPLFNHATVCSWTGLELRHVAAIVDGLSKAKALPKQPVRATATRLTRDFIIPHEWIEWTKDNLRWPEKDIRDEAQTFVNYWVSKPDGAKMDWLATWQNWCKRSRRVATEPVAQEWTPERKAEYAARLSGGAKPIGAVINFQVKD